MEYKNLLENIIFTSKQQLAFLVFFDKIEQMDNYWQWLMCCERRRKAMKLIDDLAGAIYDVLSLMLWGFSYFAAGTILVGGPLYLVSFLFEWLY